jgi:heme A synthase
MLIKIINFASPFLTSLLYKDPASIYNAFKGMSYGQAAIAFTVFMNETSDSEYYMAIFTLIFPIFIALGATLGILAQQEVRNGKTLAIAILIFIALTTAHSIALLLFFISVNWLAALFFLLSIVVIFNLLAYSATLYHKSMTGKEDSPQHDDPK